MLIQEATNDEQYQPTSPPTRQPANRPSECGSQLYDGKSIQSLNGFRKKCELVRTSAYVGRDSEKDKVTTIMLRKPNRKLQKAKVYIRKMRRELCGDRSTQTECVEGE